MNIATIGASGSAILIWAGARESHLCGGVSGGRGRFVGKKLWAFFHRSLLVRP